MKKKKKKTRLLALLAATLLATGCASDIDNGQGSDSQPQDGNIMTEFAVAPTSPDMTRTAGKYSGKALDFYWTSGDALWINKGTSQQPQLVKNDRNTIPKTGMTNTASFFFKGIFTRPEYMVRYTGNAKGDIVIIKPDQRQQKPREASHIGTDGDCGTAKATLQPDGTYRFSLEHKAAYITFMPYNRLGEVDNARLMKITVTAQGKNLAGTFGFGDSGMASTPNQGTGKDKVTLTLNGNNGFAFKKTADPGTNAATMVVAPGTYSKLTIEYSVYNNGKEFHKRTVTLSNITLTAGRNKLMKDDLDIFVMNTGGPSEDGGGAKQGTFVDEGL